MTSTTGTPRIDTLVLDAGPLIARKSLRGLARRIVTTPQVVAELKDPRVRAYWERLPLLEGVSVEIRSPNVTSMAEGENANPLDHCLLICQSSDCDDKEIRRLLDTVST